MFFLMALTHVSCVLGKETGKKLIWSILKNRHPGVLQISAFKVQLLWSQPCKQWLFPLRTSAIHILGQCLKSLFSESWDLPEMSIWEYSSCKPIVNERDWPLLKNCSFINKHFKCGDLYVHWSSLLGQTSGLREKILYRNNQAALYFVGGNQPKIIHKWAIAMKVV